MIDKKKLIAEWEERLAGTLACLDMAIALERKLMRALPKGWEITYDVSSESFIIKNLAETKDQKSVDEFMLITRLVNAAVSGKPYQSTVTGKAEDFTLNRSWTFKSTVPGTWGWMSVLLSMMNPKDCQPNVKREKVTTEVQTLSLGDVCLGFKDE